MRRKVEAALTRVYGQELGEWAYALIRPKILIERFLDPDVNTPPPDYKFHCVDGKVKFLQYIYDRGVDTKEQIIDVTAIPLPIHLDMNFKVGSGFQRPEKWSQLVDVAERIAAGFKYVRVDLYFVKGAILFGEMTFFPYGGFYHGRGQVLLGNYLDFDRSTTKPPIFDR